MRITCTKGDLSNGLALVGHATSNRNLPILSTIKITTEGGRILLEANNLEMAIQSWSPATIEHAGRCALPAKLLIDFVNVLPHDTITIDVPPDGGYRGTITSEFSEATVTGMDPGEFPAWPLAERGELTLELAAQDLKALVADVAFSASTNEDQLALTGICIQAGRNGERKITCAAADAFRLAIRSEALNEDVPVPTEVVVAAKTLKEVASLLPSQGKVTITVTEGKKQILFRTESVNVSCRLMEVAYPNFWQMIPVNYATRAVVETRLFAPIVKAAALFADTSRTLTLDLKPDAGLITVSASAEGIGTNTSTLAGIYTDPIENLTLWFNAKYIADILTAAGTPEVALEVQNSNQPGILKPVSAKSAIYLVMPMQVRQEKANTTSATVAS